MSALRTLDRTTATIERRLTGWLSADIWLLLGRVLLGLPLVGNGIAQIFQPDILESQMKLAGIVEAWKWPAIMASLLGGLAILLGWRTRLAAALLAVYVLAATLLVHKAHSHLANEKDLYEVQGALVSAGPAELQSAAAEPLRLPRYALRACQWHVETLAGVHGSAINHGFLSGCALYRVFFDQTTMFRHFTMFIPALLFLVAVGGGRFSLEVWLHQRR